MQILQREDFAVSDHQRLAPSLFVHPATLVLLAVLSAVLMQTLTALPLLASASLLSILLYQHRPNGFLKLVYRSRWLLLSLLLIYAYTAPVASGPHPSGEGLLAGLLQAARLINTIALVALLLASLTREQLLVGIYTLSRPLDYFGCDAERLTVRLWLTLHYAETAARPIVNHLNFDNLRETLLGQPLATAWPEIDLQGAEQITLAHCPFTWRDGAISLLLASAALAMLLWAPL